MDCLTISHFFTLKRTFQKNYKFIKDNISKGVDAALVVGTCFEYGMINGEISSLFSMITLPFV